jgi:hypothetical protein
MIQHLRAVLGNGLVRGCLDRSTHLSGEQRLRRRHSHKVRDGRERMMKSGKVFRRWRDNKEEKKIRRSARMRRRLSWRGEEQDQEHEMGGREERRFVLREKNLSMSFCLLHSLRRELSCDVPTFVFTSDDKRRFEVFFCPIFLAPLGLQWRACLAHQHQTGEPLRRLIRRAAALHCLPGKHHHVESGMSAGYASHNRYFSPCGLIGTVITECIF